MRTDVTVVGGGTSGMTAAIAAAQEGAKVVLVELDDSIGGVGIRAGVHFYYFGSPAGLQMEIDRAARAVPGILNRAHGYHPASKLEVVSALLERHSVTILTSAVVADVVLDSGRVIAVVVETDEETVRIDSSVTVDCTGDGDVAALAGAQFELGRAWDGATNTFSLVPRFVDDKGYLSFSNFDSGWVDPTDPGDISRAYRLGRRTAWRGRNPTDTHYLTLGPRIGIREGRRIVGDYVLTQADLVADRHFPDVVMRCVSHHDTHARDLANESDTTQIWIAILGLRMLRFGCGIPYRCLLPRGIEGLLVGCRALSQDQDSGAAFRMQRDMHKLGEVAGVAAAHAVAEGVPPRRLDVSKLQERLVDRGVLDRDELEHIARPWTFAGSLRSATAPPEVGVLVDLLGTPDESIASWWLLQYGDAGIGRLRGFLNDPETTSRSAAALCLGLLGDRSAVPHLVEIVVRGDEDRPGPELGMAEPRWIAALIVLRMLGEAAVADPAIRRLASERSSPAVLYLLHYLIAVADELTERQHNDIDGAIATMIRDPQTGEDFTVQGSGEAGPTHTAGSSMRWGVELTASYLLDLIGIDGSPIRARYEQDERAYVRRYGRILRDRLQATKGLAA
ncbi:FAD-dependent oxidoreductase [Kribbella sp. CA-245084]|uniref:FAD-dependent oxidoreductase n=1 Tax=Kribbella sp. CA-245084 TaxID=3239940 RepID=UPI003D8F018F